MKLKQQLSMLIRLLRPHPGLVAQFYDPTHCRVMLDGEDLRNFRMHDIYSKLALHRILFFSQLPFAKTYFVDDLAQRRERLRLQPALQKSMMKSHNELLANCLTYRRLWEAQGSYTSSEVLSVSSSQAEVTRT